MEELRSTDVLDKEIRADSIKKAEKIVARAEENAKALIDGVSLRVEEAAKTARENLDRELEIFKNNVDASLPLEKQRYLVSYIYNALIEAINNYFDSLSEEKRLNIVETLVERSAGCISGKKVEAHVIGFDEKKAEAMLKKHLGTMLVSVEQGNVQLLSEDALEGFKIKEGIILKAQDGSVVCRLTLDEKINEILGEKSAQLAAALFGGRIPE